MDIYVHFLSQIFFQILQKPASSFFNNLDLYLSNLIMVLFEAFKF